MSAETNTTVATDATRRAARGDDPSLLRATGPHATAVPRAVAPRTSRRFACALALSLSFATAGSFAQTAGVHDPAGTPEMVFTVDVKWLGASAYRLERDVTAKIETAVKHVPGVRRVHSTAVGARSQTSASFDAKVDVSTTASAIRTQLDQIRMRLPRDASQPQIAWHREPAIDR